MRYFSSLPTQFILVLALVALAACGKKEAAPKETNPKAPAANAVAKKETSPAETGAKEAARPNSVPATGNTAPATTAPSNAAPANTVAKEPSPNEVGANNLVGSWLARSVIVKRDGQPDETKTYQAAELENRFSADGNFIVYDRFVDDPISISGKFEVTKDQKLKETILNVSGPKLDVLKGRTVTMDFKVSADQLNIVMHQLDKAGKSVGTTESTFVRAPR